ncbi:hypothetical protein [Streptomyces cadmiisoli]|uniref:hypothetical protein n=1 Tax=Streptomyces cadmiisoli TaxID=2184053 RepID=UPI003D73ECEC
MAGSVFWQRGSLNGSRWTYVLGIALMERRPACLGAVAADQVVSASSDSVASPGISAIRSVQ